MSLGLALVGDGRMSRAIAALAPAAGHRIVTVIGGAENAGGAALTAARLAGVDVALEFTTPAAAAGNLLRLAELRVPTVTGTTGWLDRLPEVRAAVTGHRAALLHAANFSVGVQLFLRAAQSLAARFAGRPGFGAWVEETHHAGKQDAPSGTAKALVAALRAGDPAREFPVTSIRAGHVPGIHTVTYDAPHETISFRHEARGREVFAAGALAAAAWLVGREGVYTFDQMLFGEAP